MKTITDEEARQALLHELRRATCLQVGVWDTCSDVINEIFDDECDAVSRVIEITPEYAGKELTDADLDSILGGLEEMNLAVSIGQGKKIRGMGNLDAAVRLTLLKAFSNAIHMQAELLIVVSNLAQTLEWTLEDVAQGIRDLAVLTDTGMEVNEMDLHAFLGEPEAEGYTRIGGPLKTPIPN